MLVAGLIATVCADFVAKIFLDNLLFFSFTTSTLALRYYWLLALLGILLGLAGAGYNFCHVKHAGFFPPFEKNTKRNPIAFVFVISGFLSHPSAGISRRSQHDCFVRAWETRTFHDLHFTCR